MSGLEIERKTSAFAGRYSRRLHNCKTGNFTLLMVRERLRDVRVRAKNTRAKRAKLVVFSVNL